MQTLIDAGAVIVGKVKLQAMIMREEPLECVGFTAPFTTPVPTDTKYPLVAATRVPRASARTTGLTFPWDLTVRYPFGRPFTYSVASADAPLANGKWS